MINKISALFPRSSYIVSPMYDWIAFIGAPLIGLLLAMIISLPFVPNPQINVGFIHHTFWGFIVLIIMTQCHLLITVIRAYGNQLIFKKFKRRLIVGPTLIFSLIYTHSWVFYSMIIIATWWDVYHSACQTYGFTRLYDIKIGNTSLSLRLQDRILNCLIYIGPIIGGISLMPHFNNDIGYYQMLFLSDIPLYANQYSKALLISVLIFSSFFIPYYFYCAWKHSKNHPVSYQKILILSFTAIVSILAWGFNSFGHAFLIANFYHAWQYYAMIYNSEKKTFSNQLKLTDSNASLLVISLLILVTVIMTGLQILTQNTRLTISIFTTISICHFCFDGFIWSVEKKHI